jgi:hypothetical protein
MKKRAVSILVRISIAGFGIVFALLIIPAPLSGYWHTPLSDCLCDSKNLIAFQDGKVYGWASAHGLVKQELATYGRGVYCREWNTEKDRVTIRPGWFWMRITMPKDAEHPDETVYWGSRELRPGYIKEVLNTKKFDSNEHIQPTPR